MVDLIKYLNFKKYKLIFLKKGKNLGFFSKKKNNIRKRLGFP
jgi:hypothetical protein